MSDDDSLYDPGPGEDVASDSKPASVVPVERRAAPASAGKKRKRPTVSTAAIPDSENAFLLERLWSGARLAWSPNRRAVSSARLMQLLHVKQNLDLLEGSEYLETLGVPARALRNPVVFDSIFEELEAEENIDLLSRLSAPQAVDTSADVPADDAPDAPAAAVDISAWF